MRRSQLALRRIAHWWSWITTATAIFFILLIVPVYPFYPRCVITSGLQYHHIKEPMADEYRYVVKGFLRDFGVYYWDIGGRIFVRYLPYLDGNELFDQDDGILNAERKSVRALIDEDYFWSVIGREINGKVYQIPANIMALRQPGPEKYPYESDSCPMMRAVITGQPLRPTEHPNSSS